MTTDALTRTIGPTDQEFTVVFATLALQLQNHTFDEATVRSYFLALKDLPLAVLQQSAHAIANQAGRKFFPTTGEWRDVATTLQTSARVKADAGPHTWTVECTACEDTGWERFECTGDTFCGRTKPHAAHTFVRICPCRPTNRTYQRHYHA